MLKSKQIYLSPVQGDGIRISVMSRHTLNDGVTPDTNITDALFWEHWPKLAPSPRLIGDFYKRGLLWEDFVWRYNSQLLSPGILPIVDRLIVIALRETVTVLCKEEDPSQCHRSLLLQFCQARNARLEVKIQ